MGEHLTITYSSSVEHLCEINSSFDRGVLKVAYVGQNRNGSSISKEAFERNISTIFNCPIVCNYNRERDEIGSHDMEVVMKDGAPTLVNLTQPVGVIPESAKYWWETIEDVTGTHEYLCVEAIIWKRQEAYDKIKANVITDESMEISVKRGHKEDGIYVIEDFEFLAFCLLEAGKPCYESASLEMFSMDDFRKKYTEMMEEFKRNFQKVNAPDGVDTYTQQNLMRGGDECLDQKNELLARYGLDAGQIDFDISTMSLEDLKQTLDAKFALTGEQFRDELMSVLRQEKRKTEWGEMSRYTYCDHDPEASEVFCYDTEDWKLYGFTYSVHGDSVAIDFTSKKRKKFSIVDFDEGDVELSYKAMFDVVAEASASSKASELNAQFSAEKAGLEEKYNAASNTINELNQELDELRHYKQQKVADERTAREGAIFAKFAELDGVEAFENLKANCSDVPIAELEDKCFAILGRNTTHTFSASKQKTPRLPIEKSKMVDEPYGGLFLEFPPHR